MPIVQSLIDYGIHGTIVDIECHTSNSLPGIVIVGYANKSVDEAKERVRSAFASCKLELPRKRIIINLAPADVPKDGSAYDLAIAAAIMIRMAPPGLIGNDALAKTLVFGELSLDGSIRPVRGIIGKLLQAKRLGYTRFIIPAANLAQAGLISGITLMPLASLSGLLDALTGLGKALEASKPADRIATQDGGGRFPPDHIPKQPPDVDFAEVIGQDQAKRALMIAAAGSHNILLSGPPGTGKSMLAKAFVGILPPLGHEEMLDVTHLHSLTGLAFDKIITERPLRAPHHTASDTAIIGGGSRPRPGEISLSHGGVLFLDEFPEFSRGAIEALRQPLEDRTITVTRLKDSITFPADFILLATKNPCPCGYYGTDRPCTCQPSQINRYEKKLSGPILDRIDLFINVESVPHFRLLGQAQGGPGQALTSTMMSLRVAEAVRRQTERPANHGSRNARLNGPDVAQALELTPEAKDLLDAAGERLALSARGYLRVARVARTIADLDGSAATETVHVAEAVQYRARRE